MNSYGHGWIGIWATSVKIARSLPGLRHIKQYDREGIPHHERRYWRVRDKIIGALWSGVKQIKASKGERGDADA